MTRRKNIVMWVVGMLLPSAVSMLMFLEIYLRETYDWPPELPWRFDLFFVGVCGLSIAIAIAAAITCAQPWTWKISLVATAVMGPIILLYTTGMIYISLFGFRLMND
jgi:hypothetical protein